MNEFQRLRSRVTAIALLSLRYTTIAALLTSTSAVFRPHAVAWIAHWNDRWGEDIIIDTHELGEHRATEGAV
jgi:hypothetical protein